MMSCESTVFRFVQRTEQNRKDKLNLFHSAFSFTLAQIICSINSRVQIVLQFFQHLLVSIRTNVEQNCQQSRLHNILHRLLMPQNITIEIKNVDIYMYIVALITDFCSAERKHEGVYKVSFL